MKGERLPLKTLSCIWYGFYTVIRNLGSMTLVILGIDALEPELVDHWDLDNIPLES
jgi:hypothetical protein